jgi:hypothetical protein
MGMAGRVFFFNNRKIDSPKLRKKPLSFQIILIRRNNPQQYLAESEAG